MNGHHLEILLEQLDNGDHERCANAQCRTPFLIHDGKFARIRGLDGCWYCDSHCASGPYLTPRSAVLS
jgi:hypothetical protein